MINDLGTFLRQFLSQLATSLRFADVLDITLVAVFLYALLTWFRRDAREGSSRRVLAAAALFSGIYLLANIFAMYLVKELLEILLIVFLVAAVVIFQSEIRRMLDRIGTWSFFNKPASRRADEPVDVITEAVARMADEHTGAIIAIRGRESWESQLQGGIDLHGRVSPPLLYSIFHEKTPGHDGAVLIEGDEITQFGVHLPLATEMPAASEYGGTRHAAGAGLSEQTDAFVIIVSEERGTISVAKGGTLSEMETASDLKERLRRFWQQHYSSDTSAPSRWWSRRSVQTALLSLVGASLLWLVFAYDLGSTSGTMYRTFDVPIEYRNLGDNWMIAQTEPDVSEARVSLSGSERTFRAMNTTRLTASFDLSNVQEGINKLALTEENLQLPDGIDLYQAEPREIIIEAHELQSTRLPVQVETSGQLPDSLRLVELATTPDSVRLMVPKMSSDPPSHVPTKPVELSEITASTSEQTELVPPSNTRLPSGENEEITVHIEVARRNASAP